MASSEAIRRSDRRRVRPVEFWNFVKPEDTVNEAIIYNESELSKCSVFKTFSCSYSTTPRKQLHRPKVNRSKVHKTAEKGDDDLAVTVQNSTPSAVPPGKKKLEDTEPTGKVKSHSQPSSGDPTRPAKVPRKDTQPDLTGSARRKPTLGDHEVTQCSRLADTNQNVRGKEVAQVGEAPVAVMNGEGRAHPPEETMEMSNVDSGLSSDDSAASQKPRGRKRKRNNYERQQENMGSTEAPCGGDLRREVPQTLKRGSEEPTDRQGNAGVGVPSVNSAKRPADFLDNARDHHISIQPVRNTPNAARLNFMGQDVTQNTTAFEQPSFQNVFSSTAIDAPGKGVFKVPRLPLLRRPSAMSLKVSTICLDPSMVTIPEEEEEGEGHQQNREKQKNDNQEKEEVQQKKKMQKKEDKERKEQENQELQENRKRQEKKDKKKEEEKQKEEDGIHKLPQGNTAESSEGESGGISTATATATAQTGATQREKPQERTSTAAPPQPEGQEKGYTAEEDTRIEDSQNCRRSSRVRTKRLEFWNFEKVQVERQQDREVHIVHQKQDPVHFGIKTRVIDCSMACRSQLGPGVSLTTDLLQDSQHSSQKKKEKKAAVKETVMASPSKRKRKISPIKSAGNESESLHPALSPSQGKKRVTPEKGFSPRTPSRTPNDLASKKKLFSPQDNFLDKPVDEGSTFRRRIKGGMVLINLKKFKGLQFMVVEREAYRCSVAQGLQMAEQSIYTGFVFLERGQIVWNTSRKTTLYVIEGFGSVKSTDGSTGMVYRLRPRDTVEFKTCVKLSVKKDGRCKLLKLHIVLGPHL